MYLLVISPWLRPFIIINIVLLLLRRTEHWLKNEIDSIHIFDLHLLA